MTIDKYKRMLVCKFIFSLCRNETMNFVITALHIYNMFSRFRIEATQEFSDQINVFFTINVMYLW